MSYASEIAALENRIAVYKTQLVKVQSSLASLRNFLNVALGGQSDYYSCMNAKKSAVSNADGLKENCVSAQKYLVGFSQRLNGAAAGSINAGYPLFILSIRTKIAFYEARITSLNSSISNCENEIAWLREEERREEERRREEEQRAAEAAAAAAASQTRVVG